MIIPTPEFDPLFADDGPPFREKMLAYIERAFADLPGARRAALRALAPPDAPPPDSAPAPTPALVTAS